MGKWATYLRRGTAASTGTLSAPDLADFTTSSPATTTVRATLAVPFPSPADRIVARARATGTSGAWIVGSNATVFSVVAGTTPAVTYDVQMAWYSGVAQISPWSASKTQVST